MREEKEASGEPRRHQQGGPGSGAHPEVSPGNGFLRGRATPLPRSPPLGFLWLLPAACRGVLVGVGAVAASALLLWLSARKAGCGAPEAGGLLLASGLCRSLSPLFSLACAFFFLTCYLSRDEPRRPRWLLALPLCCFSGDWVALRWLLLPRQEHAPHLPPPELQMVPGRLLAALGAVAGLTLLQRSLLLRQSLLVLVFSTLVWLGSLTSLTSLPPATRPLLCGLVGTAGCLLALLDGERRIFSPRHWPLRTPQPLSQYPQPRQSGSAEEKVPVIRPRRRSSCVSMGEAASSCRMSRRPSLPCISREQMILWDWDVKQWCKPYYQNSCSGSGVDLSVLNETRNMVSDLLSDPVLPPHVISSLQSISSLMNALSISCRPKVNLFAPFPGFCPCPEMEDSSEKGDRKPYKVLNSRNSLPTPQLRRSSGSSSLPSVEQSSSLWERNNGKRSHHDYNCSSQGSYPNVPFNTNLLTIPKQRSSSVTLAHNIGPRRAGLPPNLGSLSSSSNGFLSSGFHRSPVEFPDTADFLTKPSVNVHKPLGCTFSSLEFQQQFKIPSYYTCNSCGQQVFKSVAASLSESAGQCQSRKSGEDENSDISKDSVHLTEKLHNERREVESHSHQMNETENNQHDVSISLE